MTWRGFKRRLSRTKQWIFGPDQKCKVELPDYLPVPTSRMHVQATVTTRSCGPFSLDAWLVRVNQRWRLSRLMLPFLAAWAVGFIFLVRAHWYTCSANAIGPSLTGPREKPTSIGCTAAYMQSFPPNTCGLDGFDCDVEITSSRKEMYRCFAGCGDDRGAQLGNERIIGNETINHVAMVIGGGDSLRTYRGDSWLCSAAIHAGAMSNNDGGCFIVERLQTTETYLSSVSHGLNSTSFPSTYPQSLRFTPCTSATNCKSISYPFLAFNVIMLFLLATFIQPTSGWLMAAMAIIGYWQLVLISNPPDFPPDYSTASGTFLSAMGIAYWFYRVSMHNTLESFRNLPFERAFWWGIGLWIGVESQALFSKIPLSRLVASDFQRPGAVTAIVILGIIALVAGFFQVLALRAIGMLKFLVVRYIAVALLFVILAFIPGWVLRVHHYIIAMLVMPALGTPTRLAALLQGFMLGWFFDGVGKWGFAGLVQSSAEIRGDAPTGSILPEILKNSTSLPSLLRWAPLNETILESAIEAKINITGWSLLVDDIERYRGNATQWSTAQLDAALPHFFRLAFITRSETLDFTEPVTYPS